MKDLILGRFFFQGRNVKIHSPIEAEKIGIGMVHQHFRLIDDFTVAQNVVLGNEPVRRMIYDNRKAESIAEKIIRENGFTISSRARVGTLNISQKQQVEIVRVLFQKANLLIFDEPTSVLTRQEIENLFSTMRNLLGRGKTIILITHKLSEVLDISDRITIMRHGRTVAVKETSGGLQGRIIISHDGRFNYPQTVSTVFSPWRCCFQYGRNLTSETRTGSASFE